ncbi:hypothetical protein AC579_1567 [Pseudocercospora musae]|uniref:Uncharacterized protein n=1 Tax=Pseudocercospora musae TaxID=113226 RepID=A0A139I5W6_9PEZI|nr:hypothetical protein AC579_1567 [Pseudocercospora musae]
MRKLRSHLVGTRSRLQAHIYVLEPRLVTMIVQSTYSIKNRLRLSHHTTTFTMRLEIITLVAATIGHTAAYNYQAKALDPVPKGYEASWATWQKTECAGDQFGVHFTHDSISPHFPELLRIRWSSTYYQLGRVFDPAKARGTFPETYLKSLVPSFLKFDREGSVIRLETSSKMLAPGGRVGYVMSNPLFTERLLIATEIEAAPSGWTQIIVSNLLHSWRVDGNLLCLFLAQKSMSVSDTFIVSPQNNKVMFSFVAPSAGLWAKFLLSNSSRVQQVKSQQDVEDPEQKFSDEGEEKTSTKVRGAQKGVGHFRLAFSMTSREEVEQSATRMSVVPEEFL